MDTTQQRAILDAIAQAAKEEGCLVAPVGSVYFLLIGTPRITTKDVDTVVHDASLQPPSLDVLKRIAARLSQFGTATTTPDGAVVQVRSGADAPAEIELIRGRSAAKGGFFPRELLLAAAKDAKRDGNLLIYPLEYVLVLKADAAVDREDRAKRDPQRAEVHERRANAFRADVISGVNAALLTGGLSAKTLNKAISQLKESRQPRVRSLFSAAGVQP
jgi:hypothetical protein